jgi:hypothetical protein
MLHFDINFNPSLRVKLFSSQASEPNPTLIEVGGGLFWLRMMLENLPRAQ